MLVRLRNRFLQRADGLISISSAIKEEFLRTGIPESLIHEITNGIDLRRYIPADADTKFRLRQELKLPLNRKVFVYTGRLARKKGLEMLLRVWHRLDRDIPDRLYLVLVGSGQKYGLSCEQELRDFVAANGLESSIRFTGNVTNVVNYLQAADLFVFPSETEALGLSLIEALACGLPCIASGVAGILDVIDDDVSGVLIPPTDEAKWYREMAALVRDEKRARRLGERGRIEIAKKFDIDAIVLRYREVLSDRKGRQQEIVC